MIRAQPTDRGQRMYAVIRAMSSLARQLNRPDQKAAAEKFEQKARELRDAYVKDHPGQGLNVAVPMIYQGKVEEGLDMLDGALETSKPEDVAGALVAVLTSAKLGPRQLQRFDRMVLRSVDLFQQAVPILMVQAQLRAMQGRFAEAEECYRKVLAKDPNSFAALNNIAELLALQKVRLDEALPDVNKAIELQGPQGPIIDTRSSVYMAMGRTADALKDLERAVKDREEPARLFHLAAAYLADGREQPARAAFEKAVQNGLTKDSLHPLEAASYDKLRQHFAPRRTAAAEHKPPSQASESSASERGPSATASGAYSATAPGDYVVTDVGGGGVVVLGAVIGPPSDQLWLPAYGELRDPEMRKQLQLSAEQMKRLREIETQYETEQPKPYGDLGNLRPSEVKAKQAEITSKIARWTAEHKKTFSRQIEAVLTTGQIETYKKLAFPASAHTALFDPEILKVIGATPRQRQRLRQLDTEHTRRSVKREQECIDRLLAVLTADQKQKLRAAIERREHQQPAEAPVRRERRGPLSPTLSPMLLRRTSRSCGWATTNRPARRFAFRRLTRGWEQARPAGSWASVPPRRNSCKRSRSGTRRSRSPWPTRRSTLRRRSGAAKAPSFRKRPARSIGRPAGRLRPC